MNVLNKVTRKTLALNKTRTLVTIVGIVLSVAMFTAVTTTVSSLRAFLLNTIVASEGGWHGRLNEATPAQAEALLATGKIKEHTALYTLGYAEIESDNPYKPYLAITGFDNALESLLPIHLLEGSMPRNEHELLIPQHLLTNGGVQLAPGDTLTLRAGTRTLEGAPLTQGNSYDPAETFTPGAAAKTYTVAGIYARPEFENYSAPGYTALTVTPQGTSGNFDFYFTTSPAKAVFSLPGQDDLVIHYGLLRYIGQSNEGAFNRVFYGLAAILIGIILLCSVSLIYNAFYISVNQRARQFGILKTVGATNRQIRGSVLHEALVLSAVGVPVGILVGMAGIGITFFLLRDTIATMQLTEYNVALRLHGSVPAVLIAAAIGLLTVLISAWIPARRAIRQNAIDAVRGAGDLQIRAARVRTPRWVPRLFGFEGMLADKNFKRNRRQYRATVISLVLSVVIFISASSFCSYLSRSAGAMLSANESDLYYVFNAQKAPGRSADELLALFSGASDVQEISYEVTESVVLTVPASALTPEMRDFSADARLPDGSFRLYASVRFLDEASFARLQEINRCTLPAGRAAATATIRSWNPATRRYDTPAVFGALPAEISVFSAPAEIGEYRYVYHDEENGVPVLCYENPQGAQMMIAEGDPAYCTPLTVGASVTEQVFGTGSGSVELLLPFSSYEAVMGRAYSGGYTLFNFRTSQPSRLEAALAALLKEQSLPTADLVNRHAENASGRAFINVINVFSYGFIVLISLIALANVFNTMNTNINLRRREFAMLRSVGLTERGMRRMMNFECLLYGLKSLAIGLPAAVLITLMIWRTVLQGMDLAFFLPWHSVAIAVCGVFIVVFSTMLYATRRLRRENPVDTLKQESF